VILVCNGTELCDAHKLGELAKDAKCPYYCDAIGCLEEATGDEYCTGHTALDEAGADAEEMAIATRKADRYGVTLTRLLREAVRTVPLEE
jgi:hypothetical protein